MPSKPTTTSFALLGLLGIKSWTAYEIVAQIKRGAHFFWPRSEAHLYAELKRLVERGHATSEVVEGPRRQRTRYTITPEGRAALEEWFGTEPSAPVVEVEGFLRMFLGDQATADDLRESLEATARQARDFHAKGYRAHRRGARHRWTVPTPTSPHRTHDRVLGRLLPPLIQWCEQTITEIDEWPDTRDVGLTPEGRKRLERIFAQPEP